MLSDGGMIALGRFQKFLLGQAGLRWLYTYAMPIGL